MSFVDWARATDYATWIRESDYAYPVLQVTHIAGIALLAGGVLMTNLRLLGVGRNGVPPSVALQHVLPISWIGFALVAITGAHMAFSFLDVFSINPVLGLKLTLLALAGVNALWFHRRIAANIAQWDAAHAPPAAARAAAWISIGLWVGMIACGKLLAYIGGKD